MFPILFKTLFSLVSAVAGLDGSATGSHPGYHRISVQNLFSCEVHNQDHGDSERGPKIDAFPEDHVVIGWLARWSDSAGFHDVHVTITPRSRVTRSIPARNDGGFEIGWDGLYSRETRIEERREVLIDHKAGVRYANLTETQTTFVGGELGLLVAGSVFRTVSVSVKVVLGDEVLDLTDVVFVSGATVDAELNAMSDVDMILSTWKWSARGPYPRPGVFKLKLSK